ncbi:hypothetical protein L1765_15475 [Microaerobacter geothermalis]|uniref:hypothetical protein n=1 Tax=Microaerobacter geothermalis TaxID=674972 RepID=UPI001F2F1AB9|nr:hypothetical protein [Microaerobacter geothermalis]MCF6095358.1 hypothetical protein [Microaerobacter geothermalis]
MIKYGIIFILIFPAVLIAFLFFRMEAYFGQPSQDEIQDSNSTNEESGNVIDSTNTINRTRPFVVVVKYARMVEQDTNLPVKLQIVSLNDRKVVFQDNWNDYYGLSGKEYKISTNANLQYSIFSFFLFIFIKKEGLPGFNLIFLLLNRHFY